jgi:hypothetical protein
MCGFTEETLIKPELSENMESGLHKKTVVQSMDSEQLTLVEGREAFRHLQTHRGGEVLCMQLHQFRGNRCLKHTALTWFYFALSKYLYFRSEWGLRNPTQKELVPGRAQSRNFCYLPYDLTQCIPNVTIKLYITVILNLSKGPNRVGVSILHLRKETDPVSETLSSLVFLEFRTMDKNPVIVSVILPVFTWVWNVVSCPKERTFEVFLVMDYFCSSPDDVISRMIVCRQ